MKRTITLILCAALMMSLAIAAFASPGPPPVENMNLQSAAGSLISAENLTEETLTEAVEKDIQKAIAARDAYLAAGRGGLSQLVEKVNAVEEKYNEILAARNPAGGGDETGKTPETGDNTMAIVVVMVLSMTAMAVLVSKKRAF